MNQRMTVGQTKMWKILGQNAVVCRLGDRHQPSFHTCYVIACCCLIGVGVTNVVYCGQQWSQGLCQRRVSSIVTTPSLGRCEHWLVPGPLKGQDVVENLERGRVGAASCWGLFGCGAPWEFSQWHDLVSGDAIFHCGDSVVLDVVVDVGPPMSTRLSSSEMFQSLMQWTIQTCSADGFTEDIFRWAATLVDHGFITEFNLRKVPDQYAAVMKILRTQWGMGSNVEFMTKMVRLWLGFDKRSRFAEFRCVADVLMFTVGNCSYAIDFNDVVAESIDLEESSSRLSCVRSWSSYECRSSCEGMIAAVLRVSQEAMSQREHLLFPSRVSLWLEVCVGNSGALEEEYAVNCLGRGSALRASVPNTYTSTVLARLGSKQAKARTKPQTTMKSAGAHGI